LEDKSLVIWSEVDMVDSSKERIEMQTQTHGGKRLYCVRPIW
jgi:hypothetical protein